MKNRPSPHLLWSEINCHDGTPYPSEWRDTRLPVLCEEFERIRKACGGPIKVLSGYRTKSYNASCPGAARNSQHVQGRALDLAPPKGWSVENFYRVVRAIALGEESAIYGVGRYATFVHIDVRPPSARGQLVCWQGSRAWAEKKEDA